MNQINFPPKSSGHHLTELKMQLTEKSDAYKARIDEDEITKDALLKELRALSMKLEETDRRLAKLNAAKAEYLKTQQEVNFALDKLQDASVEIGGRIDTFNASGRDPAAEFLKENGL